MKLVDLRHKKYKRKAFDISPNTLRLRLLPAFVLAEVEIVKDFLDFDLREEIFPRGRKKDDQRSSST
jgi:hypothetical protein